MRELNQQIIQSKYAFLTLFFLLCSFANHAFAISIDDVKIEKSLSNDVLNVSYANKEHMASNNYFYQDSTQVFKSLAIDYAQKEDAINATLFIERYIASSGDLSILNDHLFSNIKNKNSYIVLKERFQTRFSFWSIIYIYAGLLGFFIFVALSVKKSEDKVATGLMSLFVLFHSLFILHLSLYIINYQYSIPQTLFASTTFSFLYGPLLYFYFKRIMYGYKFKWKDALHLLPSLILFLYILPYYVMTPLEKFQVMFDQKNFLLPGAYTIITIKILSLSLYAYLIIKMFLSKKEETANNVTLTKAEKNKINWQKNIIAIFVAYVVSYIIYAGIITQFINAPSLVHLQIVVMVALVFYVTYISYAQPEIFKGTIMLVDPTDIFKYKNSGLTEAYSTELKDKLIVLLEHDKIYKQNDINLSMLSEKLDTTRHNASQVINEHFDMNFFELINSYRINEALNILRNDTNNNLNIIEVAYEVGFNNKVTFNKAFKKHLAQTPSQFLVSLKA